MTTDNDDERRCFVDDVNGDDYCAFDDGNHDGCDVASSLHAKGLCKTDCRYWRHPESVQAEQETSQRRTQARKTASKDAAQLREELNRADFESTMELAATAPVFIGNFGHGCFYTVEKAKEIMEQRRLQALHVRQARR